MDTSSIIRLAATDFASYACLMWADFQCAWHHRTVIHRLEAIERGAVRRQIICMPRRHGKSLLASQLFASWYLGRHPDRHVISTTYGQDLSDTFGRRVRNFIMDPRHQAVFPRCQMAGDSSAASRFDLTVGGGYFSTGRGGGVTGRGANLMLIDDPIKDSEEARSELVRRNLQEWFRTVAFTSLQPGAAVAVVTTRWHMDDLVGMLLREQPGEWDVLSLPAVALEDEPHRKAGEPLWPEAYPLNVLEKIREAVGSATWETMYQQRPAVAEGQIFKRAWWKFYDQQPEFTSTVVAADLAYTAKTSSDYTVVLVIGVTKDAYYVRHMFRARCEAPAFESALMGLANQFHPVKIYIEASAGGTQLAQRLRADTRLNVVDVAVKGDKQARAWRASPSVECGKVYLPAQAAWTDEFLDEVSAFPNSRHDDCVDAFSLGINALSELPNYRLRITNIFTGEPSDLSDYGLPGWQWH
jgi:predicted phage terminase large subunit-like protein